ncbi:MAG: type II toxin-antitoxin system HicB family antitoxin [Oscillospiraceae bacterium]|jgi:predicted RNase H-like HicB family nuclease|nr:type II toxin-antitoxin system HicB family antitoxin [Oscillospiraceae bacterium]
MKHSFAATFTPNELDGYSVQFPDIPSCHTDGKDIDDAVLMAQDVLCLMLYDMEDRGEVIPNPTMPWDVHAAGKGEFTSVITVDTDDYRRYYETKSVKKTLSIPAWLNAKAQQANAPYSQILQQGLKDYLGINDMQRVPPRA